VADALLLHYYAGLTPESIKKLTERQYNALLTQIMNLLNLENGGKFELLTMADKIKAANEDYKNRKSKLANVKQN
jgi:hypothetical protein